MEHGRETHVGEAPEWTLGTSPAEPFIDGGGAGRWEELKPLQEEDRMESFAALCRGLLLLQSDHEAVREPGLLDSNTQTWYQVGHRHHQLESPVFTAFVESFETVERNSAKLRRELLRRRSGVVMSTNPRRLKHPHCKRKHYPSSTYITHV
ncbi:hypothetical protein OJAV_G00183470 [Oryzias javanicus]|uniref:Uncharacterized protein n=1 Tax=Oryzias javanicus TaxID=123683 RepID=A0A3S2NW37_ORYJA|nr:hypothetical protein OJAV_G00183470 [Oryzias javanicus]